MKSILRIAALASIFYPAGVLLNRVRDESQPDNSSPTSPRIQQHSGPADGRDLERSTSLLHLDSATVAGRNASPLQPTVKQSFNAFGVSLNAAEIVYLGIPQWSKYTGSGAGRSESSLRASRQGRCRCRERSHEHSTYRILGELQGVDSSD